jgi:hypothetical protein
MILRNALLQTRIATHTREVRERASRSEWVANDALHQTCEQRARYSMCDDARDPLDMFEWSLSIIPD